MSISKTPSVSFTVPSKEATSSQTTFKEGVLKKIYDDAQKVENIVTFYRDSALKHSELDPVIKDGHVVIFNRLGQIDKMKVLNGIYDIEPHYSFFLSKLPEEMTKRYMTIVKPIMKKYGDTNFYACRKIATAEYMSDLIVEFTSKLTDHKINR